MTHASKPGRYDPANTSKLLDDSPAGRWLRTMLERGERANSTDRERRDTNRAVRPAAAKRA
jgi:hypothetical protein